MMGAAEISAFLISREGWDTLSCRSPSIVSIRHRDVGTTMIYLHVLNRGALGVRSPVDRL